MIKPVSFGSIMLFTLKDNLYKKANDSPIPDYMKLAFSNNPQIKDYDYIDKVETHEDVVDATVYNAEKNFCKELDRKYAQRLPVGSKNVILTRAKFRVKPYSDPVYRYFLTAATNEDEINIHKVLSTSGDFYAARFDAKA